jgi:hypothetical protein
MCSMETHIDHVVRSRLLSALPADSLQKTIVDTYALDACSAVTSMDTLTRASDTYHALRRRRVAYGDVPLPRVLLRHPLVLCAEDPAVVYSRRALDLMCGNDSGMVSRILEDFFMIKVPPECTVCGQADGAWCVTTLLASSSSSSSDSDACAALCLVCGDIVGRWCLRSS